jgi:hypothetical protein
MPAAATAVAVHALHAVVATSAAEVLPLMPAAPTAVAVDALHAVVATSVAEVLPPVPAESAVFVVLEIGNFGGLGFWSLEF